LCFGGTLKGLSDETANASFANGFRLKFGDKGLVVGAARDQDLLLPYDDGSGDEQWGCAVYRGCIHDLFVACFGSL